MRPAIDFQNLQGFLSGCFRLGHLAFECRTPDKRVERLGDGGMFVAQDLFSNRQRFAKQTFGFSQSALVLNDDSELGQRLGNQGVFFTRRFVATLSPSRANCSASASLPWLQR